MYFLINSVNKEIGNSFGFVNNIQPLIELLLFM